jgi:hypothetical protein
MPAGFIAVAAIRLWPKFSNERWWIISSRRYCSGETAWGMTVTGMASRYTALVPTIDRCVVAPMLASAGRTNWVGRAMASSWASNCQLCLFRRRWWPVMRSAPEMPYQHP